MDLSPADLRATYDAERERITSLVRDLDPAALATTVPTCPDWTVQDLVAHLSSSAAEPQMGNLPGADQEAWLTANVEARRDVDLATLLEEWERYGPGFGEIIEQFGSALLNVVFDVVCHEHDLRHALGTPGGQEGPEVLVGLEYLLGSLATRLDAAGLPSIRVTVDGEERTVGGGEPGLAIAGTAFELFRLLGSRRSRAQVLAAPWEGDVSDFVEALDGYGYPTEDVVEDLP